MKNRITKLATAVAIIIVVFIGTDVLILCPVPSMIPQTAAPEGMKGDTAQGRVTKMAEIETGIQARRDCNGRECVQLE